MTTTCLNILENLNNSQGSLVELFYERDITICFIETIMVEILKYINMGIYSKITINNFSYYIDDNEIKLVCDYNFIQDYVNFNPELEVLYFMNDIWSNYFDERNYNVLKYLLYTYYIENFNDYQHIDDICEHYEYIKREVEKDNDTTVKYSCIII